MKSLLFQSVANARAIRTVRQACRASWALVEMANVHKCLVLGEAGAQMLVESVRPASSATTESVNIRARQSAAHAR